MLGKEETVYRFKRKYIGRKVAHAFNANSGKQKHADLRVFNPVPGCEFQNNPGYLYSKKLRQRIIYVNI